MNDTPGDDPGQNDIQQQDLISDDVANAITSALSGEGEEMDGSSTPPTMIKPSDPRPGSNESYNYKPHPASQTVNDQSDNEPEEQKLPQPKIEAATDAPPTSPQPEISDRGSGNFSELYDIKQQALKQLSPLVEHLEQSPQEKFDTLIMMLRASDDPALIRPAYEAAQALPDDKDRAQALLDVVNEVNYLTRPTEQPE